MHEIIYRDDDWKCIEHLNIKQEVFRPHDRLGR